MSGTVFLLTGSGYHRSVSFRIRVYHPDYRVTWWDQLYNLHTRQTEIHRAEGVDYSLYHRAASRLVRNFLEGVLNISLVGSDMVRVDSSLRLSDNPEHRDEQIDTLVCRVRIQQVQSGGVRAPQAARWFQFQGVPHGTQLLISLVQRPNPALTTTLAGNLSEDGRETWSELASGTE